MNNIMETIKMARSLKRQFIVVLNDAIYGTDIGFCTLSVIKTMNDIPRPFGGFITDILPPDKVDKFANEHSVEFFSNYIELADGIYFDYISFEDNYRNVLGLANALNTYTSTHYPVYTNESLIDDKKFMGSLMARVSDGLTSQVFSDNRNTFFSQSFNSVHAINKSDKSSLKIYNYDCMSWLYNFTIKKKGYEIDEYIRYRKPNMYT